MYIIRWNDYSRVLFHTSVRITHEGPPLAITHGYPCATRTATRRDGRARPLAVELLMNPVALPESPRMKLREKRDSDMGVSRVSAQVGT